MGFLSLHLHVAPSSTTVVRRRLGNSAAWYEAASTRQFPCPSPFPSTITNHLHRLRLGFYTITQALDQPPAPCAYCFEEPHDPLTHYILHCPVSHTLHHFIPDSGQPEFVRAAQTIAAASWDTLSTLVSAYPPPR